VVSQALTGAGGRRPAVAKLQELKAMPEAIYTGAIDRLRSTVGDLTEGTPGNRRLWGVPVARDSIPAHHEQESSAAWLPV
jgi:hypothetical protein